MKVYPRPDFAFLFLFIFHYLEIGSHLLMIVHVVRHISDVDAHVTVLSEKRLAHIGYPRKQL